MTLCELGNPMKKDTRVRPPWCGPGDSQVWGTSQVGVRRSSNSSFILGWAGSWGCGGGVRMVTLEGEDWAQSDSGVVTSVPLPFQIGIRMLVSVENLEEAGHYVSFQLQIRR